jgi:hypothetical protein
MSLEALEIHDPASWRAAVRRTVEAALARRSRSLLFADEDFAAWPLEDAALITALTSYLRLPGRRLTLLAWRFDRIEQCQPRFCAWRTVWSHAVDARSPDEEADPALPTLILDDGPTVLRVWHTEPWRGRAQQDARAAAAARDAIDAWLQRSSPGWPLRPLGL